MDQDASTEWNGARAVLDADAGWPELQIRRAGRTDLPSDRGCVVARYVCLTFPEPDKILLKVGPGDHTVQTWEISKEQLRLLVLDAMPQLLRD